MFLLLQFDDFSVDLIGRKKRRKRSAEGKLIRRKRDDDMLALFRPAEQSSTAGNHPASFAVDGRSDTESSTRNEKATWFKLDLGGRYVVSKVKVHTMDHDVARRFSDVVILIDENSLLADFDKPCGIFKGPATKGQVVTFTCGEKGVTGRFLFLLKHSPDKLQINELEVIGHKAKSPEEMPAPLKPTDKYAVLEPGNKPSIEKEAYLLAHSGTIQRVQLKSDGFRTDSSSRDLHAKAVDLDTLTEFKTDREDNPWWSVDMEGIHKITMIKIVTTFDGRHYKYFHDVDTLVGTKLDTLKLCDSYVGPPKRQEVVEFNCKDKIIEGQFVKVQMNSKNDYLIFAEIYIYEMV